MVPKFTRLPLGGNHNCMQPALGARLPPSVLAPVFLGFLNEKYDLRFNNTTLLLLEEQNM